MNALFLVSLSCSVVAHSERSIANFTEVTTGEEAQHSIHDVEGGGHIVKRPVRGNGGVVKVNVPPIGLKDLELQRLEEPEHGARTPREPKMWENIQTGHYEGTFIEEAVYEVRDINGDGQLSKEEIAEAVRKYNQEPRKVHFTLWVHWVNRGIGSFEIIRRPEKRGLGQHDEEERMTGFLDDHLSSPIEISDEMPDLKTIGKIGLGAGENEHMRSLVLAVNDAGNRQHSPRSLSRPSPRSGPTNEIFMGSLFVQSSEGPERSLKPIKLEATAPVYVYEVDDPSQGIVTLTIYPNLDIELATTQNKIRQNLMEKGLYIGEGWRFTFANNKVVVAMPDGRLLTLEKQASLLEPLNSYERKVRKLENRNEYVLFTVDIYPDWTVKLCRKELSTGRPPVIVLAQWSGLDGKVNTGALDPDSVSLPEKQVFCDSKCVNELTLENGQVKVFSVERDKDGQDFAGIKIPTPPANKFWKTKPTGLETSLKDLAKNYEAWDAMSDGAIRRLQAKGVALEKVDEEEVKKRGLLHLIA